MATNPDTTRYSLAKLVQSDRKVRRKQIVLRDIVPTQALASNLYRVAYKPLIAAMTEALPAIVAAYERGLPVNDALITDSTTEAQNQTESLGETLRRLVLLLSPGLRGWAVNVEKWHREKFRGAVLSATGVDPQTILAASGTPATVQETIDWNVALIRDVGQQAQQRMASAIFSAFQARKPARDLAADLREVVALSRARSLRIASDQLGKLSGALDRERMAEAGLDRWKYRHSGKLHARPWHKARDGRIYDLKTNKQIGGDDVIEPGDGPTEPPYCGCRRQGIVSFT